MPAKLIIKKLDNNVPPSGGRWLAGQIVANWETDHVIGSGESVAAGDFVHFTVTDKTVAEMAQYMSIYNKAIDMSVTNGTPPGLLRINCRNNNTNASGTVGGWTVQGTDAILLEWNTRYPTANLITIGIGTGTNPGDTWTCEGVFTVGQASEFETVIIEQGLEQMDMRKLWYVPNTVMSNIIGAGGEQSGLASQLQLRDARLD